MGAHEQIGEDDLAKLVLDLETLDEGRHELEVTLPKAWIATALTETDAVAGEDGRALLEVTIQADRTVLVRGRIEQRYTVPCARCLEPAWVDAGAETGELCVTFVPADRLRSWAAELAGTTDDSPETDDDIEPLEPDELDQIGYQGQRIDLRALLAEQILITYPMRALCERGEGCRGLCLGCGADLNAMAEAGVELERCSSCGRRLDGRDEDVIETPWKRALSGLDRQKTDEDPKN